MSVTMILLLINSWLGMMKKNDIEQFKREIEKDFDFIVRGDGFCEMTVKRIFKGYGN